MPQKTLEKFLGQIKKGEFLSPNNSKMFKPILNRVEYEITDVLELGKTTTNIDIKIRNINMEKYMAELNSKMEELNEKKISEADGKAYVNNFFSDLVDRSDLEFSEKTITATIKKVDKKLVIENSEEIIIAMMGVGEND